MADIFFHLTSKIKHSPKVKLKKLNRADKNFRNFRNPEKNWEYSGNFPFFFPKIQVSGNLTSRKVGFKLFRGLITLNLSNTSSSLILNLKFSIDSKLAEVDFSLNNLTYLRVDYFSNLTQLKHLNLSRCNFQIFEFASQ